MALAFESMAARPCILTACEVSAPLHSSFTPHSTQLRIWSRERPERSSHGSLSLAQHGRVFAAAASATGGSTANSSTSTSTSSASTSSGRDTASTGQEQDLSGYIPRKGRNSRQAEGGEKRKEGRGPKRKPPPKKEHKGRAAEAEEASYLSPAKYAAMAEAAADEKLLFDRVPARTDAIYCVYAYPNEYAVGICSLGYQLVWAQLASREDVLVVRHFTDACEPGPRGGGAPDLVGFSLSWELDIVNLLSMLDAMGVPRRARDRIRQQDSGRPTYSDTHSGTYSDGYMGTFVFGGGAVLSANPEPYADFFDVVLMGDGEELLGSFLDAFSAAKGAGAGASREDILKALAAVPGVYVPCLYEVEYESPTGPVRGIRPRAAGVPEAVTKQVYRGKTLASSSVVSARMAWPNIFMLEVVRGCPEMCRFCLASYSSLPFRTAPLEDSLLPLVERALEHTNRIGLLGASVTQHPQFNDLLNHLLQPQYKDVRLSISSVRTNTVTAKLAAALAQSGTRSLTVAVESGSARMRDVVNKKLQTEEIYECARNAQEGGLEGLKLYSMVGLPTETEEDVDATIDMMRTLRVEAPKLHFTLGCSTFVPKVRDTLFLELPVPTALKVQAHTPFQWFPVRKEADARLDRLAKSMRTLGVDFNPESYKWSVIQAVLSRGDRRLGRLLEAVKEFGGSQGSFRRAFKSLEGTIPPMEHYALREIPEDEVLPWSHIHGSQSQAALYGQASKSLH